MTVTEQTNRKTVRITGGTGFSGSYVGDEFLTNGWNVLILGKGSADNYLGRSGATFLQGRVGDRDLLDQAFAHGIDGVVHLASSTVPSTSNADKSLDVSSNLMEALELFEYCTRFGVKKIVVASSGGTVYGIPKQLPITELCPTDPICSYGIVKLALEKYCELYQRLHGLDYAVLRISNPYGPGQNPNRSQGVISVFAAKMLMQKPVTVWGNGSVVRDFLHVRDLARLFYLAMTSSATGVFNAGSGVGLSINDLILMMGRELHLTPEINKLPARVCDVPASVLSCRKARDIFGWVPEISMERGIQQVGSWLVQDVLPPIQIPTLPQLITPSLTAMEGLV